MVIEPTPPAPPMTRMAFGGPRHRFAAHVQPIEHRFPGCDRGERQRGGFGEAQGPGLLADDPLIDEMELAVGAGTVERTGIEDLVSRLEERGIRPHLRDHTPAASQPSTATSPAGGSARRRTFVSTGLTETAFTATRMSRPVGLGRGSVTSSRAKGAVTGPVFLYPTAFMRCSPFNAKSMSIFAGPHGTSADVPRLCHQSRLYRALEGENDMKRRQMLMGLAATLVPGLAQASPTIAVSGYEGREVVTFDSPEQPGTLLVNTGEKALYRRSWARASPCATPWRWARKAMTGPASPRSDARWNGRPGRRPPA